MCAGAGRRAPRRARPRDGLLPVQQRRRRRGAALARGLRTRRHRRLRRAPRQRHAADFLRRPAVLYVSTHQFPFYPGTGAADEVGARGRSAGSPSTCRSRRAPADADYALFTRRSSSRCSTQFRAGAADRVRRLRRARARSAGVDAGHDRRLCVVMCAHCATYRAAPGALASSPKAATTSGAGGVPGRDDRGAGRTRNRSLDPAALTTDAPRGERAVAAVRAAQGCLTGRRVL